MLPTTTVAARKAALLAELKKLHADIKALQKDFKDIKRRGKVIVNKLYQAQDAKKVAEIRKKLGSV
jgi:predicted  nucleic acid-binding Zn-ribbon protein